jgi:hypothetical protein
MGMELRASYISGYGELFWSCLSHLKHVCPLTQALTCSSCYDVIPQAAWVAKRNLFSHSFGSSMFKVKVLMRPLFLVTVSLYSSETSFLCTCRMRERERMLRSDSLFMRTSVLLDKGPTLSPHSIIITSKEPSSSCRCSSVVQHKSTYAGPWVPPLAPPKERNKKRKKQKVQLQIPKYSHIGG